MNILNMWLLIISPRLKLIPPLLAQLQMRRAHLSFKIIRRHRMHATRMISVTYTQYSTSILGMLQHLLVLQLDLFGHAPPQANYPHFYTLFIRPPSNISEAKMLALGDWTDLT